MSYYSYGCPSEHEARRQGERDFECRGYRSYDPYHCGHSNEAYQLEAMEREYGE